MTKTRPSKLFLVQNGYIGKVIHPEGCDCSEYPVGAECRSCHSRWLAKSSEILDRFMFEAPGGFKAFICPECRHLTR
jgi:hypothetical protein